MKKKCAVKMANGGIVGGLFPTVSRIPGFYGDVGPEGIPMTAGAYAALPGATVQPPDPSDLNMARAQQIAGRGMEQVNNVSNMRGLSDRQKAVAIGSVAGDVARKGVDIDVSSAADQLRGLSARQQLGLSQSQYGASSAFGRSQGRGRRNRFDDGAMIGEQPDGYKDGGMVDDKADRLLRRMSDKYGISSELPALPTGAPTVRESQTVPRGSEDADRRRGFRTAKRWREGGDYPIDVKYADGGVVAFKGKGGPREDKIPVTVAGEKIMVSNGEKAVILPAKTAANPAALGIIGGLIEHTNDGRKPKMGTHGGGKYARGAIPEDEELRRTGSPIGSPMTIFGGPRPITAQEMYNYGPKASVTVPPGTVGGDMTASGRHGDAVEGGSITNLAPALRALKTTGAAIGNVFSDSAAAQHQGTTYDAVRSARIAAEDAATSRPKQPVAIGNEGRVAGISAAVNPGAVQSPVAQPQPSGARTIDGGMTVTQMGAGFDPTKLQMATGYGLASNAAGKTIGGNMSPNQYVAADGTPGARWEETQQYKDAIARNERMKLELAEIQAGKRRVADPMAIQAARQGIAQSAIQAPLDARVKQQQIQQGDIAARNANELRALYDAHKTAKTPEERSMYEDAIRVRTGKDRPEEFAHASGGTTINPATMGVEKTPDVIYSKRTGKPPGESQAAKPYPVSVGMSVQAGDGIHTFQGKQITVKAGKVTEVK
jgi:hypothetical protein